MIAALFACSGEDVTEPRLPREVTEALDPEPDLARGQYLVDHVTGCADCHTPRDAMGAPILAQYLAGAECFVRLDNGSCLHTRNLTNHETGLLNRTDEEIERMIVDGIRPSSTGDEALFPVMASFVLHDLEQQDVRAIVAYLRTVPGVDHAVPRRGPEFDPGPTNVLATSGLPATRRGGRRGALGPAVPLDPNVVPMPLPGYAEPEAALRGRYLATQACLICHSGHVDPDPRWIDYSKLFAGGEEFDVGLPTIAFAPNITSDLETGIGDWSLDDILRVIREGTDPQGDGICPPMGGAPSGLTEADALDVAHYIKSLPPVVGERAEVCPFPPT
jgi:mono/diheme cytochrome c family protein